MSHKFRNVDKLAINKQMALPLKFKSIKKNAIIFWKGHVAICLSKKRLIHAYGPRKKVIIMDIRKTINLIKKTAKLEVIGIK